MKKVAASALAVVLAAGIAACSPGTRPRPGLGEGLSGTCRLFWTYHSAHGSPRYSSFAAAYQADMAEYRHPSTPGYVYDIMPAMEPAVRITARSGVSVGSIDLLFHDKSGGEAYPRTQVAVNEVLAAGHGYTPDTGAMVWGLSDPETGDTNVASCAVAAWTPGGRS